MTWDSDDPACSGDDVSARALRTISPGVVPRPLRARVEVRRDGDHWLVRLQTESGDQSGRRILRADSCSDLQQAIALLLAMAMESRSDVLPPPIPAPPPIIEPAPAATAPAATPPAVVPPPVAPPASDEVGGDQSTEDGDPGAESSGSSFGWLVRLDGRAAHGLKPGLGLGVGVTAGIRVGAFDFGASGAHWPSTSARAADRTGYMSLTRQEISLRGCWNAVRAAAFTLAPCIAPGLAFFQYETKQVRRPATGKEGPLPNATASVDLRYSFFSDTLALVASPGLTLEQSQPFVLRLDDPGPADPSADMPPPLPVYSTERFSPRLEVGLDARF